MDKQVPFRRVVGRPVGLALACTLVACSAGSAPSEQVRGQRQGIQNGYEDPDDTGVVDIEFELAPGQWATCTGTLIAPNLVLTARHCAAPKLGGSGIDCNRHTFGDPRPLEAFYVSTRLHTPQDIADYHRVARIFVTLDKAFCGNDVAILMLSGPIVETEARLIEPRLNQPPATQELYSAVGFGVECDANSCSDSWGTRRRLDGLAIQCVGSGCVGGEFVTETEFRGDRGACTGDSGGPALDSAGRVIGVASRTETNGVDCFSPIYSRVDSWPDLLRFAASEAATAGNYPPPAWAVDPIAGGESDAGAPQDDGSVAPPGPPVDAGAPVTDDAPPAQGAAPASPPNDSGGCQLVAPSAAAPNLVWFALACALGLGLRRRKLVNRFCWPSRSPDDTAVARPPGDAATSPLPPLRPPWGPPLSG